VQRGGRWRGSADDIALRDLGFGWLFPLWFAAAYLAWSVVAPLLSAGDVGIDAHAYWLTGQHDDLYGPGPGNRDAYLYSPAFATVIWPLAQLSWPVFLWVWLVSQAAAFAWLLAPLQWRWFVPAFLLCLPVMAQGNIYALLAGCLVIGMRCPSVWAFALLTKITPGVVIVWFAARREWRSFAAALFATAAIATISFALAPAEWGQWLRFLLQNGEGSSYTLYLRIVGAVALTVFAARRDTSWLLAPALFLACPVMIGISNLALFASVPRLLAMRRERTAAAVLEGSGKREWCADAPQVHEKPVSITRTNET
jgi:hypothetical protein